MKGLNIIIFSLCAAFFIIGVYELMMYGLAGAYIWFMLSVGFLLWYTLRKRDTQEEENSKGHAKPERTKKKARNKRRP